MRAASPILRFGPRRTVLVLGALLAWALPALPAPQAERTVKISEDFSALLAGGTIRVSARPLEGEAPAEFAARISRDEAAAAELKKLWPADPAAPVPEISFRDLSSAAQLAAVRALFPADLRSNEFWVHIATSDEPMETIAVWFTGNAANAGEIAKLNGLAGDIAIRGTRLQIPARLLSPAFRDAPAIEDAEPVTLEFGEDAKGKYAVYKLRPREALYSSVVVRFTGRLHAEDVILLALRIAERSGIDDVHGIPVGFPVKIPVEFLTEEYLPRDDPRAVARLKERAETSQFAPPAVAESLRGVRIILDAGHGGRDTGTIHGGVWESTYVYDVACRLRKFLLTKTRADVVMITKDPGLGFESPDRDRLRDGKSRLLLTEPPYRLDDPVVGVNLRWYLANSWLRRPGRDKKPIPPEKTVFISIHADSLHPSVRGAMAYVPGERFLREKYGKRGTVYANYREWKEEPSVLFNRKERVAAEGVSMVLAGRILSAIRDANLPVHPFSPVRTHVIRGGREWVPAVLRYNRVPGRVLLEIANLSNEKDRALTVTRSFRQSMAEAVGRGVIDYFQTRPAESTVVTVASRPDLPAADPAFLRPKPAPIASATHTPAPALVPTGTPVVVQGPWPPLYGPSKPSTVTPEGAARVPAAAEPTTVVIREIPFLPAVPVEKVSPTKSPKPEATRTR